MRPAAYRSASETSAGPHEKFNYTYDIVGHITGWRQEHSGSATPQRWELGYDAADRLVSGLLKHATTQALLKEGFRYQKWFLAYGPGDHAEGLEKNVTLARTLREAMMECRGVAPDWWITEWRAEARN